MDFKQLLKQNLTSEKFDNLHSEIAVSRSRFTRMINNPVTIRLDEFIRLAEVLQPVFDKPLHVTMIDMLTLYHCGSDNITISEAENITGALVVISLNNK